MNTFVCERERERKKERKKEKERKKMKSMNKQTKLHLRNGLKQTHLQTYFISDII
jgi:hypothetical protein